MLVWLHPLVAVLYAYRSSPEHAFRHESHKLLQRQTVRLHLLPDSE
jgi:hypothetical protein